MSDVFKVFDDIDYEIIKYLKADARTPVNFIARELDLDVRTTKKRIERLIESQALRLTAILNPAMFGYESVCDINLKVDMKRYSDLVTELLSTTCVSYVAKGWGEVNLTLQTRFKNNRDLTEFVEKTLPNMEGVEVDSFILIPQIMHDIDHWMPDKDDFSNQ